MLIFQNVRFSGRVIVGAAQFPLLADGTLDSEFRKGAYREKTTVIEQNTTLAKKGDF